MQAPPPLRGNVPDFDRTSGPKLTADTVDAFLTWAARVPRADVDEIRKRIAAAQDDRKLLEALEHELWLLPVRDVGRHRLLISTIGELKSPEAAPILIKFIWYEGEIAVRADRGGHLEPCSFEADGDEILRARAAEMLSHLGSHRAMEATLEIAVSHPVSFVRAAAIDAHMYNAGDTPEAAAQLRGCVPEAEHYRIGLPRLTRDMDPAEFEKAVLSFYHRYPKERPRPPTQSPPPGPSARSWQVPHEKHGS
jgi:hypothetical protein